MGMNMTTQGVQKLTATGLRWFANRLGSLGQNFERTMSAVDLPITFQPMMPGTASETMSDTLQFSNELPSPFVPSEPAAGMDGKWVAGGLGALILAGGLYYAYNRWSEPSAAPENELKTDNASNELDYETIDSGAPNAITIEDSVATRLLTAKAVSHIKDTIEPFKHLTPKKKGPLPPPMEIEKLNQAASNVASAIANLVNTSQPDRQMTAKAYHVFDDSEKSEDLKSAATMVASALSQMINVSVAEKRHTAKAQVTSTENNEIELDQIKKGIQQATQKLKDLLTTINEAALSGKLDQSIAQLQQSLETFATRMVELTQKQTLQSSKKSHTPLMEAKRNEYPTFESKKGEEVQSNVPSNKYKKK